MSKSPATPQSPWPISIWVAIVVLVCVPGCKDKTMGHLTGQILVDGQPAELGAITLTPVDGNGSVYGCEIVNGAYKLDAKEGKYKVALRVPKIVGKTKIYANDPNSPIQDVMAETLPDKYNNQTELEITVVPGENTHDFTDLKALKKPKL